MVISEPRPAVFLDRDGVINRAELRDGKSYPPDRLEDFELLGKVPEACELLTSADYRLVVVTNQPDVTRGKQTRATVEAMHDRLRRLLPLDDIRVCYHDEADGCDCRKPSPGMLTSAARDFCIDLERSFMIGDRWRDIEAGQRAGCRCVFIDYGYREKRPDGTFKTAASLHEAALWILSK